MRLHGLQMRILKRECKLIVEVGETFAITNVNRIEVELQRTIDIIKDQTIVAPRKENANGDVERHAQIDGGEILYLTYYKKLPHPSSLVDKMEGVFFSQICDSNTFLTCGC